MANELGEAKELNVEVVNSLRDVEISFMSFKLSATGPVSNDETYLVWDYTDRNIGSDPPWNDGLVGSS